MPSSILLLLSTSHQNSVNGASLITMVLLKNVGNLDWFACCLQGSNDPEWNWFKNPWKRVEKGFQLASADSHPWCCSTWNLLLFPPDPSNQHVG